MKKVYIFLLTLLAFSTLTKLYFVKLYHNQNTSVYLALKKAPSFQSSAIITSFHEKQKYILLIQDENFFLGEEIYLFVTNPRWLILLLVLFLLVTLRKCRVIRGVIRGHVPNCNQGACA